MPFYLVYQRCAECTEGNCFQCRLPGRDLVLRIVEANEPPRNSINGSDESAEKLVELLGQFFEYQPETGQVIFRLVDQKGT